MLCPYCLKEGNLEKIQEGGQIYYRCPDHPEPRIPVTYGENNKFPRDVISAIGFKGHGKSLYFTALFASFNNLPKMWPGFFTLAIDDTSLETVDRNVNRFKNGELPPQTPSNFPLPTIVQFSKIPSRFKDRFLIFFDTGGENFENASRLVQNAYFVKRSQTVIFFISLDNINYDPHEMHKLLNTYIQGLRQVDGNPRDQHLLVVLTKGDLITKKFESRLSEIKTYLDAGNVKYLQPTDIQTQITEMKEISKHLKTFLKEDLGALNFLNLGEHNFRSFEVCVVTSWGSDPTEGYKPEPKRIFDPILWVMNNSIGWEAFCFCVKKKAGIFADNSIQNLKTRASEPGAIKKVVTYSVIALLFAAIIYFVFFSPQSINAYVPAFASPLTLIQIPGLTKNTVPATSTITPDAASYSSSVASSKTIDLQNYGSSSFEPVKQTAPLTVDMTIFPTMIKHVKTAFTGPNDQVEKDYHITFPDPKAQVTIVIKKKNDGTVLQSETFSHFGAAEESRQLKIYSNGPYYIEVNGNGVKLDIATS